MSWLYSIFIFLYTLSARFAARFNPKAEEWVAGRKDIFPRLAEALKSAGGASIAWFHAASLGEFEQGRPVIEAFRRKFPRHKILLTFFSPSGFEIRKNYDQADWVFYLPADTPSNARKFVDLVNPEQVFFIKYEYWFNYLQALGSRNIPVYFVSAIFRKNQHFFKWYGGWFRRRLRKITWFFLQDEDSLLLLNSIRITNASVSGDTRFDRVHAVVQNVREFPSIKSFSTGSFVLVAGSTWPEDEAVVLPVLQSQGISVKTVIAPHETGKERIGRLQAAAGSGSILFSSCENKDISDNEILIIDSVGILSSVYQYGTIAYIGGGFGKGIHNILEAAAFGIPVIFGPEYARFREARDLIAMGGAFSIRNKGGFETVLRNLMEDPAHLRKCSDICRSYVETKKGATDKILEKL